MKRLFICEKPSQAADVAKALGSPQKTATHWETAGGWVTWAFGHLKEADRPEDYNPDWGWKNLKLSMLPMLPQRFASHAREGAAGRLKEIGALLKQVDCAVIATDGGREGEVIGREILEHHNYRGRVERLWLGALDQKSIRDALKAIRPGEATANLFEAGKARAKADWLIGMNGTSAVTLTSPKGAGVYSVGRVQTPTLALVVRRDREIAAYKPVHFYEFAAAVASSGIEPLKMRWAPAERLTSEQAAKELAESLRGATGELVSTAEDGKSTPPLPYDLTALQEEADRRYGFGAKETLSIAQALYEKHKLTTYPRSECAYLPESQIADVPVIWGNVTALEEFAHLRSVTPKPRDAIFDTSKVGEHNGIVPTLKAPVLEELEDGERKIYLMIVARYVAGLLPDHRFKKLEVSLRVGGRTFVVRGRQTIEPGWKAAEDVAEKTAQRDDQDPEDADGEEESPLPAIAPGAIGRIETVTAVKCTTSKPKAYTEGTLLKDMKAVAKFVSDPAKKARLKEKAGIGTVATRAQVIEDLKANDYLKKAKRKLTSTIKAQTLIGRLEREAPALVDPGETALWEDALLEVEEGKRSADEFLGAIVNQVTDLVRVFTESAPPPPPSIEVAPGIVLTDEGEYYTAPTVKARLWKKHFGHVVTPAEWGNLLGGEVLTFDDCKHPDTGKPYGVRQVRFNPSRAPYPGLEFVAAAGGPAPFKRKSLL